MFELLVLSSFMLVGLVSSVSFLIGLYVIYDVVLVREEMEDIERLAWVVIVLSLNLIGVAAYYIIVWREDCRLLDRFGSREGRLTDLADLRDRGVLTDEEFEREKERLLDDGQPGSD